MENRNRYRDNREDFDYNERYGKGRQFDVRNDYSQNNRGWDSYDDANYSGYRNNPYQSMNNQNDYNQRSDSGYNQYDTNYNYRNDDNQNFPSYGDVYRGNLEQRERETNKARGGRFGSSSNDNRQRDDYRNRDSRGNDERGWWDRTTDEVSSWFGDDDAQRRRERDERLSNSHRGKGPRGYSRSDERIQDDVCHRLYEDSYVDASDIEVKVEGANVILSGVTNSRDEKRRAEDLAERISGVRNVENRIRVNHETNNRWQDRDTNRNERQNTMGDYTGATDNVGGIGDQSGTTNEIIRNEGRKR